MAKGQVYFDGSHRGSSIADPATDGQVAASLGGGLPPQSEPGFGPDSIGARSRIAHTGVKALQGDRRLPSGGTSVPGQVQKKRKAGNGDD